MDGDSDVNVALHRKMTEEQEKYRNWLMRQSPEKILRHTYMYAMREDILLSLEYWNLTEDQAKVLLDLKNPLAKIYKTYEDTESEKSIGLWRDVPMSFWKNNGRVRWLNRCTLS